MLNLQKLPLFAVRKGYSERTGFIDYNRIEDFIRKTLVALNEKIENDKLGRSELKIELTLISPCSRDLDSNLNGRNQNWIKSGWGWFTAGSIK